MKLLLHNKIQGFGLIEILISLVIFAVGVISVTTLNVRTYRVIKNNELADFADRTMVKALEYFKTPTTADVQQQMEGWTGVAPFIANTYITSRVDEAIDLTFALQNHLIAPISSCEPTSNFKLKTVTGSMYEGFNLCLQTIIEKRINGYKITSRVVYDIGSSEPKINQLIGYRPFTYEGN